MSGIVGSRFNTRGSGLVGSLGTDGQVFTSSGAGVSAVYEDAAGGGAWNLVSAQTASSDAYIEFTTSHITSDYDIYKLYVYDYIPDTDVQFVWFQVRQSGSYVTTGYETCCEAWTSAAGDAAVFANTNTAGVQLGQEPPGNVAREIFHLEFTLWNPLGTSEHKLFSYNNVFKDYDSSTLRMSFGSGEFNGNTNAIDGFKIFSASGNITSGSFYLYGLAKS